MVLIALGMIHYKSSKPNRPRPNHAIERTPNGACGKQCDIDGQPEGGMAGKPSIKASEALVLHLVRRLSSQRNAGSTKAPSLMDSYHERSTSRSLTKTPSHSAAAFLRRKTWTCNGD